ncbi:phycobiliprotein lyase [Rubidibacter lacunae]|nr:phycobiliprotein lyase [Rubidibacter lacunae]
MMNFFRKSQGTWYTQRSVHHFDCSDDESGESNLIVRVVDADDPSVSKICHQQDVNPAVAVGGASFSWRANLMDWSDDESNAAILVDIPNESDPQRGKLIRDRGYVESIPVVSHYWFAEDGVVTIDTDYDCNRGQERCWFITDDFRVRVSTVRTAGGVNLMTYCSEFRCTSEDELMQAIERNRQRAGGK